MPPIKRQKLNSGQNNLLNELVNYREEIKKLNTFDLPAGNEDLEENLKMFVSSQIRESENRIIKRMERRLNSIERKLEGLLNVLAVSGPSKEVLENSNEEDFDDPLSPVEILEDDYKHTNESQTIEYLDYNGEVSYELTNEMFPIAEESQFDWFLSSLKDPNYASQLVDLRWEVTQNIPGSTFQSRVNKFILKHVNAAVLINYSVTGRGFANIQKKKQLDAPALEKFIFDCFNRADPYVHSLEEASKAFRKFLARSREYCGAVNKRPSNKQLAVKMKSELDVKSSKRKTK